LPSFLMTTFPSAAGTTAELSNLTLVAQDENIEVSGKTIRTR